MTSAKARHSVILCHPDQTSLNRSIADAYVATVEENGQEAVVRNLYEMGFDPILKAQERPTADDFLLSRDVRAEIELLRGTDVFVLVYPIWFGTPPAMMKGYVERVLGAGFGPPPTEVPGIPGLLAGKRLLSFTTSAASTPWLNEQAQWMSLRAVFDHYITRIFGMQPAEHVHFGNIVDGLQARFVREHLAQVREKARGICSLVQQERHGNGGRLARAGSC